jgi:hypothetical protein
MPPPRIVASKHCRLHVAKNVKKVPCLPDVGGDKIAPDFAKKG